MYATTKQRSSDRITPIYRRLQVLKINDLYKLATAKFMHQVSDKSLPASFEKYFTRTTFVHRHSTRTFERNDYFLLHFSTSNLQRSIRFSRVKIWNSIACKFKNLFFKKFILKYKLHLLNQYNELQLKICFLFSWVAVSTPRHKFSLHGFCVANYTIHNV